MKWHAHTQREGAVMSIHIHLSFLAFLLTLFGSKGEKKVGEISVCSSLFSSIQQDAKKKRERERDDIVSV